MKRIPAAALPAIVLLAAVLSCQPAPASAAGVAASASSLAVRGRRYVEVTPGVWVAVKPARNWQRERYARLPDTWSPDQRAVARQQGFPVFRMRDLTVGVLTEIWTYPGTRLAFVFDSAGRLIDRRLG
jgi:hypothetical protein